MWLRLHSRGILGNNEKDKNRAGAGIWRGERLSHIGVINALKKVGIEIDIVEDVQLVRWWALPMHAIDYLRGRLGDLFQLLGCFTPDGSLLQRGGLLRGERVFNQYREIMRKQRSKIVPVASRLLPPI